MAPMSTPPEPTQVADRRTQLAEALVRITADRGLDAVSVREVASAAGVSIGAVQHHFATKDEMLAFAFQRVVDRTRRRVRSVEGTGRPVDDMAAVLEQLLPLDEGRRDEGRVYVAFAARASVSRDLQAIQQALLREILDELNGVLGPGREAQAVLLLATVDGMAFHDASAPGTVSPEQMVSALRLALHAALPDA